MSGPAPSRSVRGLTLALALCAGAASAQSADAAGPSPRWGAIAAQQQLFGYAFDQPTRAAAEQAARAQCAAAVAKARTSKGGAACEVRTAFNRQCAALAFGNFGEWGAASAPTREQAAREATHQCNEHLPTEPCKVAVQVCSAAP